MSSSTKTRVLDISNAMAPTQLSPVVFDRMNSRITSSSVLPPQSVEIQPTSVCHFRCSYCSYWTRNDFDGQTDADNETLKSQLIMSMKTLRSLYGAIISMGVKSVYISGGGEPLLHQGVSEVIGTLHEADIKVALITNGDRLPTLNNADKLSYIQMSLHGANREEFEKVTHLDKFDRCLNMANYIKSTYGDEAPIIGASFILAEPNLPHAIDVLRSIRSSNFDYAKFKFVKDPEQRHFQDSPDMKRFHRLLDDNQELNDPTFTNLFSFTPGSSEPAERCWSVDLNLGCTINSAGTVILCTPDTGNEALSIGNVNSATFDEIWGSERHQEIMAVLQERYRSGKCHDCRFIGTNPHLQKIADLLPKELQHHEFV